MMQVFSDGCTREANPKSRGYSTPKTTGEIWWVSEFAVSGWWEVICEHWIDGRRDTIQPFTWCPTEQEALAVAEFMRRRHEKPIVEFES